MQIKKHSSRSSSPLSAESKTTGSETQTSSSSEKNFFIETGFKQSLKIFHESLLRDLELGAEEEATEKLRHLQKSICLAIKI